MTARGKLDPVVSVKNEMQFKFLFYSIWSLIKDKWSSYDLLDRPPGATDQYDGLRTDQSLNWAPERY